jgi:hypothetical protein
MIVGEVVGRALVQADVTGPAAVGYLRKLLWGHVLEVGFTIFAGVNTEYTHMLLTMSARKARMFIKS